MKKSFRLTKKVLAVFLSLLMVMSAVPVTMFNVSAETRGGIIKTIGGISQEHTVANWGTVYASSGYMANIAKCASPMLNHVVPGLSSADGYVPQGMTYWEGKNWVLFSAYKGSDPSLIFALDFSTGEYVAQFTLYKADGYALSEHVSGIAVSNNNLYIADNGSKMSYIPLSELDVEENTSKAVRVHGTVSFGTPLGGTNTSYASFGDGCLWTGNFWHDMDSNNPGYANSASANYDSLVLGYNLEGYYSPTDEWNALVSMANNPTCTIQIPNNKQNAGTGISKIQCATVSDGKLYIGTSYGRTNDSNLYITDIGAASGTITPAFLSFTKYTHLPMTEGLFVYNGYMYNVFESACWTYNGSGSLSKNPTDVIWKFSTEALKDNKQSIDNFNYNGITSNKGTWYKSDKTIVNIPDTVNSAGQGEQITYRNVVWAGNREYDCAVDDRKSDKSMIAYLSHQPLVMVYDGISAPRAPIMTVIGATSNTNRYTYIMSISDNDNNSLSLANMWLGSRDSNYGDNWDWINVYNRNGGNDMKIATSQSNTSSNERIQLGKTGGFLGIGNYSTTPGFANIVQFNGSLADNEYSKAITFTITAYTGSSETVTTTDIVQTLKTNTPVYVVNYKPYVDYITTVKSQYSDVTDLNNVWTYTEDSLAAYYQAVENYVNFDLGSYFTNATKDNYGTCAANCGNGIRNIIQAYKNAYNGLQKKTIKVTFEKNDGTKSVISVAAGNPIGSFPSNTPCLYNNDKATHVKYDWNTVLEGYYLADGTRNLTETSVPKTAFTVHEISSTENCSFNSGEVTTEPTCTLTGVKTFTCSVCGGKYTESVDALGHDLTKVNAKDATCTTSGNVEYWHCSRCSKNFSDAEGTIEIENVVTNPTGHTEVIDAAVEATCTQSGLTEGKHCSVCNTVIVAQQTIPAKGHTIVTDPGYEATEDNIGLTDGSHCSVCNEVLEPQTIIPPIGKGKVYEGSITNSISTSKTFITVTKTEPTNEVVSELSDTATEVTGRFGTMKLVDGKPVYTVTTMSFSDVETFWAVSEVSAQTNNGTVSAYVYEKISIIPAKTLYYEDNFDGNDNITFSSEWETVGTESNVTAVIDAAGFDYNSQYKDCTTYSAGSAKKVTVSAKPWPTATFTFAGTGFDIISVTSAATGIFAVTVKDKDGNKVKSKVIDTYYGYEYGRFCLDRDNYMIVIGSGEELYETTADKSYDISLNGKYYTTVPTETAAYGWIEGNGNSNALYQVPVISIDDLAYGTYTVTVEARFTTMFGHADNGSFDLIFDAVRIHNPANPESAAVTEAYAQSGEDRVQYTSIKKNVVGSDMTLGEEGVSGLILVDGKDPVKASELEEYTQISPNNELYISAGQSIAFTVVSGFEDVAIGIRSINGKSTNDSENVSIIYGNTEKKLTVNTATELYYSIGSYSGPVVIKNNSTDAIISLTNLKTKGEGTAMMLTADTAPRAQYLLNMVKSDLSVEEVGAETDKKGTVTLTLTTSKDVANIVIKDEDGNIVTPDNVTSEVNGDEIIWTVTLTESASGEYVYAVSGEYENGYTNGDETKVTVEITKVVVGDMNGDGAINTADRMILARYLAKWNGAQQPDEAALDINGDGVVNTADRMILSRAIAQWDGYIQYIA